MKRYTILIPESEVARLDTSIEEFNANSFHQLLVVDNDDPRLMKALSRYGR